MGYRTVEEASLVKVADQIREKAGTSEPLEFPDGFVQAVSELDVGGVTPAVEQATPTISVSSGGLITASAVQQAGKVAAGTKTATKQLTVQAAQTITPGTYNKTISSGRYLTGTQTIRGDANLTADNIVSGVSIFGVAGTAEVGGVELPELTNPGGADKLVEGYQLIDGDGNVVEGAIVERGDGDLTASGSYITVPAGHYPEQVSKSVGVKALAAPSISVSSSGLITAAVSQSAAGWVAAGSRSSTKQLSVRAARTITPGTQNQTIASGTYLTGTQTIQGDANLAAENIVSGVSIFGVAGTAEVGGGSDGDAQAILDRSVTAVNSAASEVGQYALRGCTKLLTASFPNATKLGNSAFYGCTAMTEINVPNVETLGTNVLSTCSSIKEVLMPKVTKVTSQAFYNCASLERAEFPAATSIDASALYNCPALSTVILRSDAVVSLAHKSAFTYSGVASGTGYVYVPSALVDSYKAATNWSNYADQIRAIEDYPEITGG